jgi:hypothetical protein
MPLQKQEIVYNLGVGGVDQKTDDKFSPLGRPTEMANVRFPKTGRISKRFGLAPATTDTVNGTGTIKRLFSAGRGLLAAFKNISEALKWYLLVRGTDDNPTNYLLRNVTGTPPVAKAWVDNVVVQSTAADEIVSSVMAIGTSHTCYVYQISTSNRVYATIADTSTGLVIRSHEAISLSPTGTMRISVFAVPLSNSFVVVCTGNATSIVVTLLDHTGVLATNTALTTNANRNFDCALFGYRLIIAYQTIAATTVTVSKFDVTASALGSATTGSAVVMTTAPVNLAIAVPYTTTEDAVILSNDATNGTRALTVSTSTLAVVQSLWSAQSGAIRVCNLLTGARLAGGFIMVVAEEYSASDYLTSVFMYSEFLVGATPSSVTILARNMYLCSKPVVTSATFYPVVVIGHLSKVGSASGLQNSRFLFIAGGTVGTVVARFTSGRTDDPQTALSVGYLPDIAKVPADGSAFGGVTTEYICPAISVATRAVDESGTRKLKHISAMRFDVQFGNGYATANDGQSTIIQAGYLATYDGRSITENGFLLWPEIISATASNGAGTLPVNGSYRFVAVFTYLDNAGQLHRSAPSEVVTGTTGATDDTFTVLVRGLTPSLKDYYGIELYRTENAGTIFYLAEAQYEKQPNANDTVSFTVTGSDSSLIASTPLGQQSGILDNEQPSSPVAIASNGRRLLAVAGDDRQAVIEGKERIDGEGASFMAGVTRRIAQGGEITGLHCVGNLWVATKKRSLYIASGDGADDTGQSDSLSEFEPHQTVGVGCDNQRHAVVTPLGLIFRSERGYYLLDAGRSIIPLGVGIDEYKDFPLTTAVFHEDRNEVHFLLRDGPRLVLSLHETSAGLDPRWSIDEDDASAEAYGDIAVVNGLLYAATEDRNASNPRTLMVEDVGGYGDQAAGYPVVMRFTTGWIPITGRNQGRGRLYEAKFLGTVKSVHTARIRAAYNYIDTWIDDKSITSANATAGGAAPYQWVFRPTRPKIQAVRFEFTETLASAGEGLELNQIVLTVGVEPGSSKVRRTQRAAAT